MEKNMVQVTTEVVTNVEVVRLHVKALEHKMRVWRDVVRQYDMDAVMPEPDAASASCNDASAPSDDAHDSEDEAEQLAWAMKMSMKNSLAWADDDAHAPSAEDDESLPSRESIAICLPSDRTNANDDSENANDGEPHGESGHRRRL